MDATAVYFKFLFNRFALCLAILSSFLASSAASAKPNYCSTMLNGDPVYDPEFHGTFYMQEHIEPVQREIKGRFGGHLVEMFPQPLGLDDFVYATLLSVEFQDLYIRIMPRATVDSVFGAPIARLMGYEPIERGGLRGPDYIEMNQITSQYNSKLGKKKRSLRMLITFFDPVGLNLSDLDILRRFAKQLHWPLASRGLGAVHDATTHSGANLNSNRLLLHVQKQADALVDFCDFVIANPKKYEHILQSSAWKQFIPFSTLYVDGIMTMINSGRGPHSNYLRLSPAMHRSVKEFIENKIDQSILHLGNQGYMDAKLITRAFRDFDAYLQQQSGTRVSTEAFQISWGEIWQARRNKLNAFAGVFGIVGSAD